MALWPKDEKADRKAHQKAMRDVVERAWDKKRNKQIEEQGLFSKKGKHRKND